MWQLSVNIKNRTFNKTKKFVYQFCVFICLTLFVVSPCPYAQAATSYVSPSSGSFTVGNIFTASVFVNTKGVDINNAEGVLRFPTDLLEVVSVSRSGSIFSLWVEEPNFSNGAGTLSFNGGLPTPGYNGTSGKIFSVVFRAKKAGSASVLFSSASILANDGLGTNVLTGSGGANYDLVLTVDKPETKPPEKEPETKPKIEEPSGLPATPKISSQTHPDQSGWYANSSPKFQWSLYTGVTGVRYMYDGNPSSKPSAAGQSYISEKQLQEIKDGIWYSHVQFNNEKGLGGVAHYRFQIDTTKPNKFEITDISKKDVVGAKAEFIFDAEDSGSGVDHYEVQIDNGDTAIWKDDGSQRFEAPALNPGSYLLNAKVFDKAGNYREASAVSFSVQGLNPPIISEYPNEISSKDVIIVRGATIAKSEVTVWLQKGSEDPESFEVQSNRDGSFVFVSERALKEGEYSLWTEVVDGQGLRSEPSEKMRIQVIRTAASLSGSCTIISTVVTSSLIGFILLLVLAVWYGWYRYFAFKKRVKKEVSEAKISLYDAFDTLKKEIRDQMKVFDKAKTKREVSNEEERVTKQLGRYLDSAEKSVKKEIEDIEKAIR
jgi:hypothetical protein